MDKSDVKQSPCLCFKYTQYLQDRVRSLELKVESYGQLVKEFEDFKKKRSAEARASSNAGEFTSGNVSAIASTRQEKEDVIHGPTDMPRISFNNEQDTHNPKLGDDPYIPEFENSSIASSSDWVIDESNGLDLMSDPLLPQREPKLSGNRSFGIMAFTKSHEQNGSNIDNWQSLDEPVDYSLNNMISTEQIFPREAHTGPERKRQKRSSGSADTTESSLVNNPLVCRQCPTGHVFLDKLSLNNHIKINHSGDQKTFVCAKCHKSYLYKEGLANHWNAKHLGIRYACGTQGCDAVYTRAANVRKHQIKKGHPGGVTKYCSNLSVTTFINGTV